MTLPSFFTINEKFLSLFDDHFNVGNLTLNLTTTDVNVNINHVLESKALQIETANAIHIKPLNMNLITKLTTAHVLNIEASVKDLLNIESNHSFSVESDVLAKSRQVELKNAFAGKNYNCELDLQFKSSLTRPTVSFHSLLGRQNYFVGGHVVVDHKEDKMKLSSTDVCMGYAVEDFTFLGDITYTQNFSYTTTIYQKINEELKLGLMVMWDQETSNITGGVVGKMDICKNSNSFVKFKSLGTNNLSMVYGFDFLKGIKLALSGSYNIVDNKFDLGMTASLEQ